MNTKTNTRRPANAQGEARPASSNALAALLSRSSRAERESYNKSPFQERSSLPPLHTIGVDGQDHINISGSAESHLGKLLSIRNVLPFEYDVFGHFTSIEGFQYYIRSKHHDELFRELNPVRARMRAEKEPMHNRVPNQRALVLDAIWQRITQLAQLRDAFVAETLPFDLYVVNDHGQRSRPANTEWLVTGINVIRKALQQRRAPLLLDYMDKDTLIDLSSASTKQKLAFQRRVLRSHFLDKEQLDQLEAQEALEAEQRAERSRQEHERRKQAEAAAELPADAVPIEGLHLTTDVAVDVTATSATTAAPEAPVQITSMDPTTLVRTSCQGVDLMNHYADGRTTLGEANSTRCGGTGDAVVDTVTAALLSTDCVGFAKYGTYADGEKRLIEDNSVDCGGHGVSSDAAPEVLDGTDGQAPAPIV